MEFRIPSVSDRAIVDAIIFDELCQGIISDGACREYARVIEAMQSEGCDVVALSCTEIPLLVTSRTSPLPILDSTRLLAHAAVDVAIGQEPLPIWRGGLITDA